MNRPGSATFVVEPLPPFEALEPAWRALDRSGAHSFFLSWTWIGTLLRSLSEPPLLLRALRDGVTAGLALLTQRQGRLRGILPVKQAWLNATGDSRFDCVMIEHNGFALAGDTQLWPDLVRWFAQGGIAADELVLPGVTPDAAQTAGVILAERLSPAYRTPLASLGAAGIESAISRNARQQLRRSMRDYEAPLSLDVARDAETALDYFARLKELHVRSWTRRGRRHAFDSPFFDRFHRALIVEGLKEGAVDLMRVAAGARVLGYLYNFRRNGVVSAYQSGFDDETPGLRPGYVCHALAIAHYAAAGMTHYDFLAGTNRLKQSFGVERYELSWSRWRRPTAVFRAERIAMKAAEFLRRRAGRPG